ncbi:fam-a protein [Plasmodium yoelii]|uniref:Fam-a protein n=2 Tax=Plasmodium yoelii TaxID=5861 RepID=A0AAE9WKN7_PLAYO|nr:fam-a protein [Plasmodium yoelii]WBY55803.1 fam-a protein [Plasmodium yoelii yoelii]VTZ74526.1 fam-a protein [Plasmodium yoelii]|eukprot:XP_022811725.1 fam-a protein [Plasmodium yoelii]
MNKVYIRVVLFILSLFIYMNNNTFAAEHSPKKTKTRFLSKTDISNYIWSIICRSPIYVLFTNPDNIFKPRIPFVCTKRSEIKKAENVMEEAIERLKEHAIHSNDYNLHYRYANEIDIYRKRHKYVIVDKIDIEINNTDKYEEIIDTLFNFNNDLYCGGVEVKGKVAREYNPNLVMIQQRFSDIPDQHFRGYLYAIATKQQVSEDTTIIALTSANINDYNHVDQNLFKNLIVESANSFETEVDSENYIRKRYLKKAFVHLSGYIIKKKSKSIQITSINAIEVDNRNAPKSIEEGFRGDKLTILINIKNKYSMK